MTDAGPALAAPATAMGVLHRWWWLFVLRGAVGIVFGLVAFVWPSKTAEVLVLLFAAWMIVEGGSSLLAVLGSADAPGHRGGSALVLAVEGLLGVAAGVIAFVWPQPTLVVIALIAGAWALVTGVLEIVAAIRLRREMRGEWLLALAGAASVVAGVVLIAFPTVGIVSLTLVLGAYAVAFGVVLVGLGIRLWRLQPSGMRTR